MDATIKEKWVAALRSGDYKQGKKVLHNEDNNTYCCLGVLCDIAVAEGVVEGVETKEDLRLIGGESDIWVDATMYDGAYATPPRSVQAWAGIDDLGSLPGTDKYLTNLNDYKGYTFDMIADEIEAHL